MKKSRIMGQEVEYGFSVFPKIRKSELNLSELNLFGQIFDWTENFTDFLANGARFYLDSGEHPEYATPECLGPRQLVFAEQAGDRILAGIIESINQKLEKKGLKSRVGFYKNNTDGKVSWGCHENYLVSRPFYGSLFPFPTPNSCILITYLFSSIIFTGSGKLLASPDGSLRFRVSQRGDCVWEPTGTCSSSIRPMIHLKDEHLCNGNWRRLHIIGRDSNMSPLATYLKFGTCSIILDMLETGNLLDSKFVLSNPIASLRQIDDDLTLKLGVECQNGKWYSVAELQAIFLEKAAKFVQNYGDKEDKRVISEWGRVLNAIFKFGQSPELLVGEIDWITKKTLIEKKFSKMSGFSPESVFSGTLNKRHFDRLADIAGMINLQYHDIRRDKGLFYAVFAKKEGQSLANPADIERLILNPPKGTRADLRGFLIKKCQNSMVAHVNWSFFRFSDPKRVDVDYVAFDNPYKYRLSEDEYLKLTSAGLLEVEKTPKRFLPLKKVKDKK